MNHDNTPFEIACPQGICPISARICASPRDQKKIVNLALISVDKPLMEESKCAARCGPSKVSRSHPPTVPKVLTSSSSKSHRSVRRSQHLHTMGFDLNRIVY